MTAAMCVSILRSWEHLLTPDDLPCTDMGRLLCAQKVIAVKFCPLLFERAPPPADNAPADRDAASDESEGPFGQLPYRMVFAVATTESVMLYDTGGGGGALVAMAGQLHCDGAPITDLAWACDGRSLAVSSLDGAHSLPQHWLGSTHEAFPLHAWCCAPAKAPSCLLTKRPYGHQMACARHACVLHLQWQPAAWTCMLQSC